jgi:hypothetical protein
LRGPRLALLASVRLLARAATRQVVAYLFSHNGRVQRSRPYTIGGFNPASADTRFNSVWLNAQLFGNLFDSQFFHLFSIVKKFLEKNIPNRYDFS